MQEEKKEKSHMEKVNKIKLNGKLMRDKAAKKLEIERGLKFKGTEKDHQEDNNILKQELELNESQKKKDEIEESENISRREEEEENKKKSENNYFY